MCLSLCVCQQCKKYTERVCISIKSYFDIVSLNEMDFVKNSAAFWCNFDEFLTCTTVGTTNRTLYFGSLILVTLYLHEYKNVVRYPLVFHHWIFGPCYLYQLPNIELVDVHKTLLSCFNFPLMHSILRVTFWVHWQVLMKVNIWCFFCKVKVNFTLEQATKAQRGSRRVTLPFP
jgi:hypothetical protein